MRRYSSGGSPRKKAHPSEFDLPNRYYDDCVAKLPSLTGKVVAITGTTSGTGYFAAQVAIEKGAAALIQLNRPSDRASFTQTEMALKATSGGTTVIDVPCDLMSLASVRAAAAEVSKIAAGLGGLDVLALNAGVMAMADERTVDGLDVQMQVNAISQFLLTKLLMPALENAAAKRGESRVVGHSSGARFFPLGSRPTTDYMTKCDPDTLGGNSGAFAILNFLAAQDVRYFHSKLANPVFAMALHAKLHAKGSKVKSLCAEPGIAATSLLGNGWELSSTRKLSDKVYWAVSKMFKPMVQSGADGACPLIAACFGADATSGDFYVPEYQALNVFGLGPYLKGPPIKTIVGGIPRQPGMEARSLNVATQEACWAAAEVAMGEKFVV